MKIRFGLFVAGSLALWVARDSYRPLDQPLAFKVIGLTLLAGATVLAWGTRRSKADDSDSYFPKFTYLIVALLPWLFVLTLSLNAFLDRSSPMQHPATVVSKSETILGRRITVTSWRPGRNAESIPVDAHVYPSLPANGPIIVSVKPGLLGIPWVNGFERRYQLNLRTH